MTDKEEVLRRIRAMPDPVERIKETARLQVVHQELANELARERREALEEALSSKDITQAELARLVGVSRSRIGQLRKSGPAPERAFLSPGGGDITVIVGQKPGDGPGRSSLAQETVVAYNRLSKLARSYDLDTEMDPVRPPKKENLNRDDLIVLSGPRLLNTLWQILEGDDFVRFRSDGQDWWLRDESTGQDYRTSPEANRCYGYLGRLPRPDGRGTFLVCSGIRAIGTQGVVAHLEDALPELYAEVKTKRFSTLVMCEYDPNTMTVTSAERVSPIYRARG